MSVLENFVRVTGVGCSSRVAVLGMGGGCDVFSAYVIAEELRQTLPGACVMCINCIGPRNLEGHPLVGGGVYRLPSHGKPLVQGKKTYHTTLLEQSLPRGDEGGPFLIVLQKKGLSVDEVTQANIATMSHALNDVLR
eukprot:Sspe_Gene.98466::Locus_71880_Transcript_1_1_Confidence_1.000_Length_451::g.98466::m.98466